MSAAKRQRSAEKPARKPRQAVANNWVTKPLTDAQKATLCIAARGAFDFLTKHGLVDGSYDDFRHTQTNIACGKSSLRDCTNREYRSILARFYALACREEEAKKLWAKTGRVKGSDQIGDTIENREVAIALIHKKIADSDGKITEAYVESILADQHPGTTMQTLSNLSAAALQNLVYTLTARLSKK
jgi:hypothetical protein